ncbi:MAG: CDP-alcohol phosphatidyltransferase family protein, partial [Alkalispirochaeta sp.]
MLDRMGRSWKDTILNPLERAIPQCLSPNAITGISLLPGLAAAVLAGAALWGWAIAAFAVNRVLDGLDGIVARARDTQTDFGGYLDIMADFAVYAAIPIGVWLGATDAGVSTVVADGRPAQSAITTALPVVVLLAIFYLNAASWMYLSALIERRRATGPDQTGPHESQEAGSSTPPVGHEFTTIVMPTGVVEGTETVVFFALFLVLPDHYATLFWIMAAATAGGVVQRVLWARRT